jgi:molybdenum cofactor cytidylyltransferase
MDSSIAAIILAAGGSTRFGSPKQLLKWQGETLINRVINLAKNASLDPVIVVLGSEYERIKENILEKEKLIIIKNRDWEVGQSSSLIAGVRELATINKAFVVLLCDQPQITANQIESLVKIYRENDTDVVITEIAGKIIPPVIFSPICISGIVKLKGDSGARSIINDYRNIKYKERDQRLSLDIDTLEDFYKLKNAYKCA